MAVAAYTGSVTISPSTVIHDINSMEIPLKVDTEDTTSFSSSAPGTKTYIPTLQSGQFKVSGFRNSTDAGQNALRSAWLNRTQVSLIFEPADSTETYSGSFWVTDWNPKADVKGTVTLDVSLLLNGACTITDTP